MSKNTIGSKIKKIRKERKLTQEQLAESLGYSGKSVISHIEKGDADMTYEKILLLLRTYALDANELFEVEKIDKLLNKIDNIKKKDKIVVYIHGLHGTKLEADNYLFLNNEFDVVDLDYKDGNPWEVGDIIRQKFINLIRPYKEVIIIANSIGAFYAYTYLYDLKKVSKAFFISPIADMYQIIFNIMMDNSITESELENKKVITCSDGTVLSYEYFQFVQNFADCWDVPTEILYGSQDELVYIENITDFLSEHPNSRLTIKKGSEHYFHTPEEKEFIKDWILKNI